MTCPKGNNSLLNGKSSLYVPLIVDSDTPETRPISRIILEISLAVDYLLILINYGNKNHINASCS